MQWYTSGEWLILARKKRHMWPMQMTTQVAAVDVPTDVFMHRETPVENPPHMGACKDSVASVGEQIVY